MYTATCSLVLPEAVNSSASVCVLQSLVNTTLYLCSEYSVIFCLAREMLQVSVFSILDMVPFIEPQSAKTVSAVLSVRKQYILSKSLNVSSAT